MTDTPTSLDPATDPPPPLRLTFSSLQMVRVTLSIRARSLDAFKVKHSAGGLLLVSTNVSYALKDPTQNSTVWPRGLGAVPTSVNFSAYNCPAYCDICDNTSPPNGQCSSCQSVVAADRSTAALPWTGPPASATTPKDAWKSSHSSRSRKSRSHPPART